MLSSMTGYASVDGSAAGFRWTWRLKSVNGRGLDLRVRLPIPLESFEPQLRKTTAARLARGSVSIHLDFQRDISTGGLDIDKARLEALLKLSETLEEEGRVSRPSLGEFLALKGVMDGETLDDDVLENIQETFLNSFEAALLALDKARKEEGKALQGILQNLFDDLEQFVKKSETLDGARIETIRKRLSMRLDELLDDKNCLNEERLEQEVALLAQKADVREELDRLKAHIDTGRSYLKSDKAVGRKLDFLSQELNREANTLCSKSADIELTNTGLAMKAVIDQIKEQGQNIE